MQLFKNNAYSTLGAALTNVATTLTVATGQGDRFPVVAAPDFMMVTLQDAANNIEIVKVTARAAGANSMTIQRAQEGTTARAWSLGDVVELRITEFALRPLEVLAGADTDAAIRLALNVPTRTGGDASGTWGISITGSAASATTAAACSGNAATATTLATARTINGTSFNGSANITTANWGTSRTITIGTTGKSVNGSANVSWTLAEIGAAEASATVNLTGDQTISGTKNFGTAPVVPGLNGGQLAGMRNKVINGAFKVNQRAYVSGAATSAGQYTLDRWKVTSTSGITFSTASNKTTVTISPGQTLQQVIEGLNLESGTYVLSWEGTAQGRIAGGTYGASGAVTAAITGGTNTTIEFNAGTLSDVQLERSPVATPFEHRPYGQELALCQRYARVVGALSIFGGRANGSAAVRATIHGVGPMRATPTASDVSAAAYGPTQISSKSGGSVTVAANTDAGVVVEVSGFSGLTDNRATALELQGALTLSAEL